MRAATVEFVGERVIDAVSLKGYCGRMAKEIEVIARAVILRDDQLLVCKAGGKEHYFLPGGHVEPGELAKNALEREIMEELGVAAATREFLGVVENLFEADGASRHEINLLFRVQADIVQPISREKNISFAYVGLDELPRVNMLPEQMKEKLLAWLADKKPFWGSSF
jgi:8-oxo-dGTP diphosphatase